MTYVPTHEPFTWSEFNALPFDLRDGVNAFWEPGYDYDSKDFWTSYPDTTKDFIQAVRLYDWLMQHAPEGDETGKP